ncbi:TPA_asm: hypothetical protein G1X41_21275, partial [Salmonella enterica subsp. enterica serovar Typhimurium str. SL1344]|nr:hypothetical protein [Salmonella enterica subsp. enterica serovar Typhimurium str. SL1344]
KKTGEKLFFTRDIAREMNISVGETRKYLDELHLYGVIGCEPGKNGVPVLWFLY